MTDKYEEFKKWFKEKGFHISKVNEVTYGINGEYDECLLNCISLPGEMPFKWFEAMLFTKEEDKKLKQRVSQIIYEKNYWALTIGEQEKVRRVIDELKMVEK